MTYPCRLTHRPLRAGSGLEQSRERDHYDRVSGQPADCRRRLRLGQEYRLPHLDETLDEIVGRLAGKEEHVLVVQNGQLVGVLSLGDISSWVKRARELGVEYES